MAIYNEWGLAFEGSETKSHQNSGDLPTNASDHENEEFEEIKESDSDLEILENNQDVKTLESDELKKVSNNNNSEVADQTLVID